MNSPALQEDVKVANTNKPLQPGPLYAAIDLGSNSFHLLLTCYHQGMFIEVKRNKQLVQLARGMDKSGKLDSDARDRAESCLRDFRLLLDDYPDAHVIAVATKALRMAADRNAFLQQAQQTLGHPITLISGEQEAHLVYQGICSQLPSMAEDRMIFDIGGASTEVTYGNNQTISQAMSLDLGCVTSANLFFPNNDQALINHEQFQRCKAHALHHLQANLTAKPTATCQVYSASGTLTVLAELMGLDSSLPVITDKSLSKLVKNITQGEGVPDSIADNLRYDVIPAGVAILAAIFDHFSLKSVMVCASGLKEGLLVNAVQHEKQM